MRHGVRVSDTQQYEPALGEALKRKRPTLLDVNVDRSGYPAIMEVIRGARRRSVAE